MKLHLCVAAAFVTIFSCSTLETTVAFSSRGVLSTSRDLNTQLFLAEEKKGFFGNFFDELDAFVDDATNRRLGAGAAFYGKRKSNFYGGDDKNRKANRTTPDPTEDYQGPSSSGYFQWMQDDDGQMRPVTRMKGKVIERNPNFWDRAYPQEEDE